MNHKFVCKLDYNLLGENRVKFINLNTELARLFSKIIKWDRLPTALTQVNSYTEKFVSDNYSYIPRKCWYVIVDFDDVICKLYVQNLALRDEDFRSYIPANIALFTPENLITNISNIIDAYEKKISVGEWVAAIETVDPTAAAGLHGYPFRVHRRSDGRFYRPSSNTSYSAIMPVNLDYLRNFNRTLSTNDGTRFYLDHNNNTVVFTNYDLHLPMEFVRSFTYDFVNFKQILFTTVGNRKITLSIPILRFISELLFYYSVPNLRIKMGEPW